MSNGLSTIEKVFMVGTSLVVGLAVVVSLWQGYETRRHNRLSVKPLLSFDRNFSRNISNVTNKDGKVISKDTVNTFSVRLKNQGFGPAIIQKFQIFVDGEAVSVEEQFPWEVALKKADYKGPLRQSSWFIKGDVIQLSQNKSILKVNRDHEVLKRIRLQVDFKSIYDEGNSISVQLYD